MNLLMVGNVMSGRGGVMGVAEVLSCRLKEAGWNVITTSSQPKRIIRLVDIVSTIIRRRHDYSLANVEVYSGTAFIWAETACEFLRWLKKPLVLTLHGGNLPAFTHRWPKRVHDLLSKAAFVTTPSYYLQENLKPFREDIIYLPNGIDLQSYQFKLRNHPKPKLCWLRAFHEIYNPRLAVEVVAILQDSFPDIHLTMIGPDKGDGSLKASKQLVDRKGLGTHIHFAGPIPKADVPVFLQIGDIFLNTTRYESFGIAVMEAAATGLCIVTTDVGELRYLWSQGQNALLVPADDPTPMANAVRRILTEPGLASLLSARARQKAEQFAWPLILTQWERLFKQVLANTKSN
jgi:glycosyltransferase involved in cell wall biosynthesis